MVNAIALKIMTTGSMNYNMKWRVENINGYYHFIYQKNFYLLINVFQKYFEK